MDDENIQEKAKVENTQIWGYVIGELSFVILPFLVLLIMGIYKSSILQIFNAPEWALAAAVMHGQSIVKMIYLINRATDKTRVKYFNIGAFISIIIVIGLVPCLLVLALIYISQPPETWLVITQIVLFIISITVFTMVNHTLADFETKK